MVDVKIHSPKWNPENETLAIFLTTDLVLPKLKGVEDKRLKEILDIAVEDGFKGEYFAIASIRSASPFKRVIFVGIGHEEMMKGRHFRESVGHFIRTFRGEEKHVSLVLPTSGSFGEKAFRLAQLATEGVILGNYRFCRGVDIVKEQKKSLKAIYIHCEENHKEEVVEGIERGRLFAEANVLTRDLVNDSASTVTPEYLADVAKGLAKKHKEIKVKVFDEKELQKEGFGGIWGVGRGSDSPPRFIRLKYTPPGKAKKRIALIGKGITFDTGGVDIKTADGMETMKEDMTGAGAVLGVFSALPALQPKVEVIGLISSAENMLSGYAYKPGDILTTYSGKTIEVINTDAEGRIVLADAFGYCGKHEKVDAIIDMATLTGAASLALGRKYMAGFFTDNNLRNSLYESGERAGEKIWEFPLDKEYMRDLKSEFADIKNAPIIRQGGTIHGAIFLYYFLEDKTLPWAHLDIAPISWSKEYKGHISFGGTGVTVRTLLEYFADENLW